MSLVMTEQLHPSLQPRTPQTSRPDPLLTPAEVAALFRVDPKTVTRWANAGKLSCIRTLGGHRRYRESEVRALLQRKLPRAPRAASTPTE
jgi:excisionase family DNA binding protein